MADFAEFDPLVSPITKGSATETKPVGASQVPASKLAHAPTKFSGVSEEFLFHSKWHPLNAADGHALLLAFRPSVGEASEDAVHKLQREMEEKAARDAAEKAERERLEQARQQEAIAAAAAGKEAIGEDAKKVTLPSPKQTQQSTTPAADLPPVDPELLKQQQQLERLAEQHEKEERQRVRYNGHKTVSFKKMALEGGKGVEYVGRFQLQGNNVTLSDVSLRSLEGGQETGKVVDVPGTFTLTVSSDGKKLNGKIDAETIEFELIDSDADKALEQLLLG